jgi:hypothetical protein
MTGHNDLLSASRKNTDACDKTIIKITQRNYLFFAQQFAKKHAATKNILSKRHRPKDFKERAALPRPLMI